MIEDGLHAEKVVVTWDAKWLLAKHLEVGQGCNKLEGVANIAAFREVLMRPGFQVASSTILALGCLKSILRRALLKKTSGLRCVLHFYLHQTL